MNNLNLVYGYGSISYQASYTYSYDNEANVLTLTLPNFATNIGNTSQFINTVTAEILLEIQMQQLDVNKSVVLQIVFKNILEVSAQQVEDDVVITVNVIP